MKELKRCGVEIKIGDVAFLEYMKVSLFIKRDLPIGICRDMSYEDNVKKLYGKLNYQRLASQIKYRKLTVDQERVSLKALILTRSLCL